MFSKIVNINHIKFYQILLYQICYLCSIYLNDYVYKFWQETNHICKIVNINHIKFYQILLYQICYLCSIYLNDYVYKFWQETNHI